MADTRRLAVVSGGSGGIGRAVVLSLAEAGDEVVALGRSPERLADLADTARERGFHVATRVGDLTDPATVESLAETLGPVSVLVNNAGDAHSASLADTDLDLWRHHLDANATSAFLLTRELLPGMLRRDRGRIVFVASTAAHTGSRYTAAYTAAKHAVLGLARSVAAEVASGGVTANTVCPSFVRTPLTERSISRIAERTGRDPERAERALAASTPLGRLIEPEEVAAAVAYLASPLAGAVNGQTLTIDGGDTQR
ncbi:SDR family NAD(P)-dependent oxidoreductase [Nocardiopsis alba]|uniref:SDR family NAD(P)-dependent oxidoreductase n=1 Tax=Nocardiopsis alba TaxID=53437 RepID=UPI0033CDF037